MNQLDDAAKPQLRAERGRRLDREPAQDFLRAVEREQSSRRVLVVACTERAPTDEEWTRFMTRMSLQDYEHMLIATSGGGPTAVQRKKANQFWKGKKIPRISVLTESRTVVAIVAVLNWFLDNRLRVFRPDNTHDALNYLELPPSERQALLDTASRLGLALSEQGATPANKRRA